MEKHGEALGWCKARLESALEAKDVDGDVPDGFGAAEAVG
jgi:hypothetical protein